MERERSEAFERLRPVCVSLTREQNTLNARQLVTQLKLVDVRLLSDLQLYVLFPLRLIFKQQQIADHINEDLLLLVCESANYILSHTTVSNWEMLQDFFTGVTCVMAPSVPGKELSSEELKLSLIRVLESLLKSTDKILLKVLYSAASLPPLGHAVSVLLPLVEREKSRDIQLAALDCLSCLCQTEGKSDKMHQVHYGNIVASFLPGIAMSLTRVITGDSKQGHAVISRAMDVFSRVVCLVMSNSLIKEAQTGEDNSGGKVSDKLRGLVVMRTEEWVKTTGTKMAVLLRQIASVRTRSNWRIRLALVNWADQLLIKCSRSLKESIPILLEALVGLIGDEYPNVARQAQNSLQTYQTQQTAGGEQTRDLREIVEENLLELVTALPRQIRSTDEDQKLGAVNLLAGYLSLLGSGITSLLHSRPHLHRLSHALVQCLELDCQSVHIVEQRTALPAYEFDYLEKTSSRSKRSFRHFRDERIEASLYKTCHQLGQNGDLDLLTDVFLDMANTSRVYRTSCTLVINQIIAGLDHDRGPEGTERHSEEILAVVKPLLDEYLSQDTLKLPTSLTRTPVLSPLTSLSSPSRDQLSVSILNQNITHMSLSLEGVGVFARVLGVEFKPLLIHTLYPLLEKTGDESALVSDAAYRALVNICLACNYRSVDELVRQNADYLMNSISLRLRHLSANPDTPQVLQVILHYSQEDILQLLEDTIHEILSCLDDHHQEEATMFMKVLHSLTMAVNRWFPPTTQEKSAKPKSSLSNEHSTEPTIETKENSAACVIRDFFLDYHSTKCIAAGDVQDDGIPEEGTDDVTMETDTQTELPKHVTTVKEILSRTKHLLSSSRPRLRLLVLDTVAQSTLALSPWPDELLPLLHELWKPMVARFNDEEKLVTIKALTTLKTMCDCSGDFLRKRIFKDVVPRLASFLSAQATISRGSAKAYLHTVNFKLQLECLTSLPDICHKVEAQTTEVDHLAKSYLSYLSCLQPKSLQEASVRGLQLLIQLDADAIWLQLCDLYLPSELSPPGSEFKPVMFLSPPGKTNEYADNVMKLLPFVDVAT